MCAKIWCSTSTCSEMALCSTVRLLMPQRSAMQNTETNLFRCALKPPPFHALDSTRPRSTNGRYWRRKSSTSRMKAIAVSDASTTGEELASYGVRDIKASRERNIADRVERGCPLSGRLRMGLKSMDSKASRYGHACCGPNKGDFSRNPKKRPCFRDGDRAPGTQAFDDTGRSVRCSP